MSSIWSPHFIVSLQSRFSSDWIVAGKHGLFGCLRLTTWDSVALNRCNILILWLGSRHGSVRWVKSRAKVGLLGIGGVVIGVILLDGFKAFGASFKNIIGFSTLGDTLTLMSNIINVNLLLGDWSIARVISLFKYL